MIHFVLYYIQYVQTGEMHMITSKLLEKEEYSFLHTNPNLGHHIILLGLAGSCTYGTNNGHSDIEIRGIALNRRSDLIGMTSFEQHVDGCTDTAIYGFNKIINLLLNCSPNVLELLGLNTEHYLYLNDMGQSLLDNARLFLTKRAMHLVRLFMSAIDILEKEIIRTYRKNEQKLQLQDKKDFIDWALDETLDINGTVPTKWRFI